VVEGYKDHIIIRGIAVDGRVEQFFCGGFQTNEFLQFKLAVNYLSMF